jgi:hypothetical protein
MTAPNLPSEISHANALRSWQPPSTQEVRHLMTMVRVATRAMKLSDKLGDLSDYVSADEA